MSIKKRGNIWWARFTHDGQEIQRSSGTEDKAAAQEWHDQLKASLWRQDKLKERPAYIWEQAVERWLTERLDKPTAYIWKLQLRWLHPHLSGMKLTDIGQEKINQIRLLKQKDTVNGKTEVKPRTVNAILNLIRSILRAAIEWEWIDRAPVFKLLAEPTRRVRYLSQDEEQALLYELPLHLQQITRFALSTGLRMSNILTLEWSQIDIARETAWIHADQAKANKAISIPLNTDAIAIIHEQLGQHASHVFSYKDKPILRANGRAWREAVKRANIQDFNFHGLRHTWASRLIQAGVPTHALMELGGWSDIAMVRKYAHFGAEHLREYANKISIIENAIPTKADVNLG